MCFIFYYGNWKTMYRLANLKLNFPYYSIWMSPGILRDLTRESCTLCSGNYELKAAKDCCYLPLKNASRVLSTKAWTAVQKNITKRKRRKSEKKYPELLEATDALSFEEKTLGKLSSKCLFRLTGQPELHQPQTWRNCSTRSRSDVSPKSDQHVIVFIPQGLDSEIARQRVTNSMKNMSFDDSKNNFLHVKEKVHVFTSVPQQGTLECEAAEVLIGETNSLDSLTESHLSQEFGLSVAYSELNSKLLDLNTVTNPVDHTFQEEIEEHHELQEVDIESMSSILPSSAVAKENRKIESALLKKKHKKKHSELLTKMDNKELDQAAREESLTFNLVAYLDLCVNCGLLNRGLSTLNFYRSRSRVEKNIPKLNDVKLYDILLHGFAAKSNLNKIMEILNIIEEERLRWSLQTFSACFEYIGRHPRTPFQMSLLSKWLTKLDRYGWTPNDVITKATYVADQRDMVLKAIQYAFPHFKPEFPPPERCYSCTLLQELNYSPENWVPESQMGDVMTLHDIREAAIQQIRLEVEGSVVVKSIEKRTEPSSATLHFRKKLEDAQLAWKKAATDAFLRDLEVLRVQQSSMRSFRSLDLYPYLCVLKPEEYVDIILKEIRRLAEGSETFSPTTSLLYRDLGNKVRSRYEVHYKCQVGILNKVERLYEEYCQWYANPSGPAKNGREKWQLLVHGNHEGPDIFAGEKRWSPLVLSSVGKFLYNIILRDIRIDVNLTRHNSRTQHFLPAFYTLYRNHGRYMKEEIKPHPTLARLYRSACLEDLMFDATLVPMLSPPLPWVQSSNAGGYIIAHTELMRLPHQAVQQRLRLDQVPGPQLYPAFDSLNQLGAVPWTINEPVLDVVIDVFNKGGSSNLDIPQPPSACPAPPTINPEMNKMERFSVFRQRMAIRRRRAEMYSLWCDALYRLSLANHFRHSVFWLPHNMDFRGRVYPCPPHLSHLGSDMARALLHFAKGKPLGPRGLDWLKIHLINLTGRAKRDPVDKRLEHANNVLLDIFDSADRPLTGKMWWAQSDEPWQTLACCMEVARAIRSGNPEEYVSHFPVHQDGSCNGLQHYAALGRDQAGAESVNLSPSLYPQDVYSCVAALVERERMKDAAEGLKIAEILEGFVQRKVVKQTVMTTVYGVTRFGARLQIARQLKDIDTFPKEYVWQASIYLVGKTFESLREMFTSTKEIQDWFTECARVISQIRGQSVEWVTPLGLPVVQPYNRVNRKPDSQNRTLHEQLAMDMFERPNVMKQKNAFPPNFIHSLDSSHMMLTSLFCERAGITFVSVHDCFWTHACTVGVMNKICREQFVAMHSEPILENLSQYLLQKFGYPESEIGKKATSAEVAKRTLNGLLRQLPKTGDFDLKSVLSSVYFFS